MKLTLVGLPLGNIEDISLRAIETISQASLVICEDTRRFNKLYKKLQNLGYIEHDFSEEFAVLTDYQKQHKIDQVIEKIQTVGEALLVSDAGLPTISDPGYKLINTFLEQSGELDIVPGPTAAFSSLAISGFSSDRVLFVGFLPKKTSKRELVFSSAKKLSQNLSHTLIIYESPYRLKSTIDDLKDNFPPDTQIVVVRELTKKHQQVIRSTLQDIQNQLPDKIKGEVTVLVRVS